MSRKYYISRFPNKNMNKSEIEEYTQQINKQEITEVKEIPNPQTIIDELTEEINRIQRHNSVPELANHTQYMSVNIQKSAAKDFQELIDSNRILKARDTATYLAICTQVEIETDAQKLV